MDTWDVLLLLKGKLATVPGVATCRIGIEAGLSPDDYPIVRLIPERMLHENHRDLMRLTVYYGMPIVEADGGLEALYAQLYAMEMAIKWAVRIGAGYSCKFIDTVTDEDRLDQYKLFASRFEVAW